MTSFDTLGLSGSILDAVTSKGYKTPTPIQQKAIPTILAQGDILAAAQTGTGKTAGFTLPMLELLSKGQPATKRQVRSLVLTPTRELAAQVGENVAIYGKGSGLSSAVVFGGVKIPRQIKRLEKGCDILVATPGRLLDLYNQGALKFDQLEIFVLDEADRMLDMGFIHDIRKIISLLPKRRQNLMFSATFSNSIRTLAKTILHKPTEISVATANSAATTVTQWMCPVDKKRKPELLHQLINDYQWKQMLVFMRTKHSANKLTRFLEGKGLKAAAIHGNKSQAARTKALTGFKNGQVDILVATDIAARGLDIDQLPQVVNFDLPQVAEDYVHRIGRTGRAGATGQAVSLVSADEFDMLTEIERLLKKRLERKLIDGFEPLHDLPASKTDEELKAARPSRNSQPRKPGPNKNRPPRSRRSNSNKPRRSGNQAKPANRKPTGNKKTSSTSGRSTNRNR